MRLALSLFLLAGCQPTESSFESSFPVDFCAYAAPCVNAAAPGSADTGEVTEDACTAEVTDYVATVAGDDGCTFNADAAGACLSAIADASSCADGEAVRDACEGVFTGDSCDLHLDAML